MAHEFHGSENIRGKIEDVTFEYEKDNIKSVKLVYDNKYFLLTARGGPSDCAFLEEIDNFKNLKGKNVYSLIRDETCMCSGKVIDEYPYNYKYIFTFCITFENTEIFKFKVVKLTTVGNIFHYSELMILEKDIEFKEELFYKRTYDLTY